MLSSANSSRVIVPIEVETAPRAVPKLRINYIMARPSLGGGTRSSKLIAEAMVRRGHEVRLIYVNKHRPLPPPWRVRSFIKSLGSRLRGADSLKHHHILSSSATLIPVPKLRIEADDVPDGDVVMGSWWETMEWIDALPAEKGLKVHYVRGNEVAFQQKHRERVHAVYRMPHLKVTISGFLRDLMAREYGRPATVVHNGVEKAQFDSEPRGKNTVARVGLVVGAHPMKGAHTAFDACRIVQQSIPNLQVIGFGMEALPARAVPPANFEFHHQPAQQKIPDIYRSCDCWIVPSVTEGLSMPGLEAAACRCPVVATRCGGTEDYVVDGVNGYLVPVENPEDMAGRLVDVLNADERRWREMSEASYRIARTFDWDQSAEILEGVLNTALSDNMISQIATPKMRSGFSAEQTHEIAERAWRQGDGVQQLLKRDRAMVARVTLEDGQTVIAKLWSSPGVFSLFRRKIGTSNCQSASKALRILHQAGVAVPRPLGECVMLSGSYTEAMLVEDLGDCILGIDHVKKLLREGREAEHDEFVDQIFEMTEAMLKQGVLDPDHGLHNILVGEDGRPVRIDFEVAKIVRGEIGKRPAYGEMLGRLLTSYIFAVQPDLARIQAFAQRIEQSLNPPAAALRGAGRYVQEQMAKQRATMNVDTRMKLDW